MIIFDPSKYQNYYSDDDIRLVCHAVKQVEDPDLREYAIRIVTQYLVDNFDLDEDFPIVPVPSHVGYATYTKDIAAYIASQTGSIVLDIIKCDPHESFYEMKKHHGDDLDRKFYLSGSCGNEIERLFVLDNVIATGSTISKIADLFEGIDIVPLVYAVDFNALSEHMFSY